MMAELAPYAHYPIATTGISLEAKRVQCWPQYDLRSHRFGEGQEAAVLLCPHYRVGNAVLLALTHTSSLSTEWLSAKVNKFNNNKLTMNNGFEVINEQITHDLIWIYICRENRYQFENTEYFMDSIQLSSSSSSSTTMIMKKLWYQQ
jgi:hypothetical protein